MRVLNVCLCVCVGVMKRRDKNSRVRCELHFVAVGRKILSIELSSCIVYSYA